jgi:hypothetical protein
MLPAPAALVACLALAGVTRYTAGVSAASRYYSDLQVLQPIGTSALELEPRIGLEQEEPISLLSIAYYPRLVMIADSPPPQFFNQASASLALQPEPRLRLTASASGCYGTNDFRVQYALTCGAAAFATAPGTGPQPIPIESTVRYMSAYGAFGTQWQASPRLNAVVTLSYLVQGGADAPTREVLPLQRGPGFLASLEWAVGRDDALTTSVSGSYYAFLRPAPAARENQLANNAWIAQLVEAWQHGVARSGRFRLGLGTGLTGNAVDAAHLVLRRTSAVGELSYQQSMGPEREGGSFALGAGARVAPFVDFTTGLAYDRADAFASLGWALGHDWRLDASLSAGIVLDGVQRGQATGTSLLGATFAATEWCRLSAALSGLWQRAGPDYPASTFRQVSVILGATFLHVGVL